MTLRAVAGAEEAISSESEESENGEGWFHQCTDAVGSSESEVEVDKETNSSALGENCECLGSLAKWTMRRSRLVICGWLVLTLVSVPFAVRFQDALKINSSPPPGTGAALAEAVFQEYFPANALTSRYIGYLEAASGSVFEVPGIDDFCRELQKKLNASRPLTSYVSQTTYKDLTAPLGGAAPGMPVPLWTKDKKVMLIVWTTSDDPSEKETTAWAMGPMHSIFMDLVTSRLGSAIAFRGTDSYSEVAGEAVPVAAADLTRVDAICMPITAVVLYLLVRSWRLVLITGATLGSAASISFAFTYLAGGVFPVMAATPSIMMCLIIAMSVDYSIFLLIRFKEEMPDAHAANWNEAFNSAIATTLATSGATIFLSGSVLFFAFVFMACFPVLVVSSMGVGACFAMATMVCVNLTLVPALLSEFRTFFTTNLKKKARGVRDKSCSDECWRYIAKVTTKFPHNVGLLSVVVLLSAAISYPCFYMHTSGDSRQIVARGTRLSKVCELVSENFGGGLEYPFEVLLIPTDKAVPILSKKFFQQSSTFLKAMQAELTARVPEANETAFNFLSFQTGTGSVFFEDLDLLCDLTKSAAKPDTPRRLAGVPDLDPLCSFFIDTTTNTKDYRKVAPTAAYGVIVTNVEPLGKLGYRLLDALRKAVEIHGPKNGLEVAIAGNAVASLDMVQKLYSTFPYTIVAVVVTAALFLMIVFRSVVIPVRSLLSNMLTLGFTYGFTVLVYQNGILDFLGMKGLNSEFKSLPWCAPVVVFFIIFGIGLDYDIFLLVRITEIRARGAAPQQAIQEGLISTGGIITAAGLVMACAFGGMIFSAMFQEAMFGFMICIAVLFDTFIARSIVTPAGMSILGYWNWWPSRLSKRDMADYELEDDDGLL